MIGLDTNVLLRWLMDDSIMEADAPHQSALIADLVAKGGEQIFINHIVVVEAAWVLKRRARLAKDLLISVIERLLNSANVVFQERDLLLSALRSYSKTPGDFSDHLIGEINKQNGCRTTLTFDKAASRSPQFSELQR